MRRGGVQVIRGPRSKSVQWPRAMDGKPQQPPLQHRAIPQQGRWRQLHFNGRQGLTGTEDRDPAAAPRPRRVPWHKSAFPSWSGTQSGGGTTTTHLPVLREALKKARQQAVPLSTQDKGCAVRELLGTGQKGGWQPPESWCCKRHFEPSWSAHTLQFSQLTSQQRLRGLACSGWNNCRRRKKMPDPSPTRTKRVCRREDFVPQCDEEMQEWIQGRQRSSQRGHCGRATPRSHGEVISCSVRDVRCSGG